MMIRKDDFLGRNYLLFDGATGTEYQKLGLGPGVSPELWNIEHPERVRSVHRAYLQAGSNVIETNSFGGSSFRLKQRPEDELRRMNETAAKLAKAEAGAKALVAGSIGPLGELLEPYGDVAEEDAFRAFLAQSEALLEGGADLLLIETMVSLQEAAIALKAAKQAGADVVGVTLTFDDSPHGPKTSFGDSLADIATMLEKEGATFIGSNCGDGFEIMEKVAVALPALTSLPVLIQPNAGMPRLEVTGLSYPETASRFGEFVLTLRSLGIRFIGGCCGTTPGHIREASMRLGTLK